MRIANSIQVIHIIKHHVLCCNTLPNILPARSLTMSGIEIAGLLLGAFPLLVSALEHYRQSAEVLEDWWQIKKEYGKCKSEIKLQELLFEHNLERFLLPLVVDDDEIAALIAEPGGIRWKDPALELKLKSRLPRSYDLFIDTIHEIQSAVDGLREELGITREAFQKGLDHTIGQVRFRYVRKICCADRYTPSQTERFSLRKLLKRTKKEPSTSTADRSWKNWLSRPNLEYQTQRVKFTFGKANRTKHFEELARNNARLKDLLDTNDKSAALKQSRRHIKDSAAKKALWNAGCMRQNFTSSWARLGAVNASICIRLVSFCTMKQTLNVSSSVSASSMLRLLSHSLVHGAGKK